jgi:hypothetical protein
MQTKFIKQLRNFYEDWWVDTTKEGDLGLIICIKGQIYEHNAIDMSLSKYNLDYLAMGSGAESAIGSGTGSAMGSGSGSVIGAGSGAGSGSTIGSGSSTETYVIPLCIDCESSSLFPSTVLPKK